MLPLLLWAASCAVILTAGVASAQETDAPAAAPSPPPTDDEVMYRVFSAEVLGARGELEKAAAEYLAAALESPDPQIAERATSVAVAAQAWQYAAMAADRWVLLQPDKPEALQAAARTMLMAGDYLGAEHQLDALLKLLDDRPREAWAAVAALLGTAHHPEKTRQVLDSLVQRHGAQENPWALLAASQVAARSGELERAMVLAEAAAAKAGDDAELHAWAGRVAMNLDDRASARRHFEAAWQASPQERMIALLYAELLRQEGEAKRAHEILAGLEDTPEMRFTRVAFALQGEDRERAERLYQGFRVVEYDDAVERAFHAARSAEMLGLKQDAIDWYLQLEDTERETNARQRRAALLADTGRLDEARAVLAKMRQGLDTEGRVDSLILEGQLLQQARRSGEAYQVLSEALVLAPDHIQVLYIRALVAVELDRLDQAEDDLRAVIDQQPENAAALNALGYTLADRTDRLDEAEALVSKAYALQPEEPSIIDSMGWVAYRRGRLEEAEGYLQRALELEGNAEIAAHLGEVRWMRGDKQGAREAWSMGLEIEADNPVLAETLERLGVSP